MKNIVHTLTLAQMRANPRRTLVTLVGVVLSVTMLTAVFAGAAGQPCLALGRAWYRQVIAGAGLAGRVCRAGPAPDRDRA